MRRSKNPKLRDRMDPHITGELGGRKDAIRQFANDAAKDRALKSIVLEGRQWEMSDVQIRKAMAKAVNKIIKGLPKRRRA